MLRDLENQNGLVLGFGDKQKECYQFDAITYRTKWLWIFLSIFLKQGVSHFKYSDAPKWKSKRALIAQFRKTSECAIELNSFVKKQDEDRVVMSLSIDPGYTKDTVENHFEQIAGKIILYFCPDSGSAAELLPYIEWMILNRMKVYSLCDKTVFWSCFPLCCSRR